MRPLLCLLLLGGTASASQVTCSGSSPSLYSASIRALREGKNVTMDSFKGKVSLVMNVASFCGGTPEGFRQLTSWHNQYAAKGLEILAFQCSQFLNQAPGNDTEFLHSLQYVRPGNGFIPPFPIFSKVDVNGQGAHPLWSGIRSACPSTPGSIISPYATPPWVPITSSDVSWNFEKIVIDRAGVPFMRFSPDADPNDVSAVIERLLQASQH